MRDTMIFYRSYLDAATDLPDDLKLKFYEAIFNYGLDCKEPTEKGTLLSLFKLIKPVIDRQIKNYENGKLGAEHGKKGGRGKKINPQETPRKPPTNPDETPYKDKDVDVEVYVNVNKDANKNVNANVNKDMPGKEISIKLNDRVLTGYCLDNRLYNEIITAKEFDIENANGNHMGRQYFRIKKVDTHGRFTYFDYYLDNSEIKR